MHSIFSHGWLLNDTVVDDSRSFFFEGENERIYEASLSIFTYKNIVQSLVRSTEEKQVSYVTPSNQVRLPPINH